MSYELRAAVRGMLLPIAEREEEEFLEAVTATLDAMAVQEEDRANWISVQLRRWKSSGQPSNEFKSFVKGLLFKPTRAPQTFMFDSLAGDTGAVYLDVAARAADQFFAIHKTLVDQHLLTHDGARQILSHAGMIVRLAIEENMTASEISRLISVRDNRFLLNWRAVQAILAKVGRDPSFAVADAEVIYESDLTIEPLLFGDLDLSGSIERVAAVAQELGCGDDFNANLRDILLNDLHAPYLVMLHYQLMVQGMYDHAVTYLYEFKPRGQAGDWLTSRYAEAGIPVAKNPFLNNAKATLRLDATWVAGRTDSLRSATAVAKVLVAIENLGALAKSELAAQIRGLLHRYIRITSEQSGGVLPAILGNLSDEQSERLLAGAAAANTRTTGIVEQRIVDCFGSSRHSHADGWTSKGLGDSVFAANTFRKKFGDIEFVLPVRPHPRIVAYESHGGRLTRPYVEDHLDSFRNVLSGREDELVSIADIDNWLFEIVFVAHEFEGGLPNNAVVALPSGNANLVLTYTTFAELRGHLVETNNYTAILNEYLVEPLNDHYVHSNVRSRVRELIEG